MEDVLKTNTHLYVKIFQLKLVNEIWEKKERYN